MENANQLPVQAAHPSVFEYDDYRLFLRDSYAYLKVHARHFSFRYFSKRAGFASPNFLKLVMEGKRNLSLDSIPKFVDALKLTKSEGEFFAHLVHFSQSRTATERSAHAKRILRSKSFRRIYPLKQAEFSYYACWYYIPVRELAAFPSFREDYAWIATKIFPTIEVGEARQALCDLEALGLLRRDETGRLVQSTRTVSTENEVSSASVIGYHREMLRKASESIETVGRTEREISSACIPVSREMAQEIKKKIQDFRNEILSLASQDEAPDRIYQLNFQLFPLSQFDCDQADENQGTQASVKS